ncbi:MAG TPA: DUF5666 domain-containing protein [Blastocatellia bacterium]|nr:DUF5666 domain-containing protein [Blastocatellia bacterium]
MKSVWNGFAALLTISAFLLGSWPGGGASAMFDGDDTRAEITGPIISLPTTEGFIGLWQVGRSKVNVTAETRIDQSRGRVAIGAIVEVEGVKQNDGSIKAAKIEVKFPPPNGLPIKFSGKIEELPSTPGRVGDWKVSGKVIHVSAMTRIDDDRGRIAVGAFVEIEGLLQNDGSINALRIEVKPDGSSGIPVKFLGRVERLPDTNTRIGDWVVSGRMVRVTANTEIDQDRFRLMVGSLVEVEGVAQSDGVIVAARIEVKGNIDNPTLFVTFRGVIESLPDSTNIIGDWKVSGRVVKVSDRTVINAEQGRIVVGAHVIVSGALNIDGSVAAQKIEVREAPNPPGFIRFMGRITALPNTPDLVGDWKVGERVAHVSTNTRIDQTKARAAVGALVEVEGTLGNDRSVDATKIEVKSAANDTANFIRFFGEIAALPPAQPVSDRNDSSVKLVGDWTIGGKTVHVGERTRIRQEHGGPRIGAFVEVEGNLRTDNTIDASVIEVELDANAPDGAVGFIHFYGQIKSLPQGGLIGDWTVGTKSVHVTNQVKIEPDRGKVVVNAFVAVSGYLLRDDTVTAIKVEVRRPPDPANANVNRSRVEFFGTLTDLPDTRNYVGDWTVGGKAIHVKERTVIFRERAAIALNVTVEVYGAELADGSIDAKLIEVEHGPAGAGFVAYAPVASVNAGNYQSMTAGSTITAAFGSNLASRVEFARSLPLPLTLGGASVLVDGKPVGLFYASPNQLNFLTPEGLLPGSAQMTVMRDGNVVAQGSLSLGVVAPSVFTADSSGSGRPAGILLRVRATGEQVYEPLTGSAITRQPGDRLFLVLFGTGMSGAENSDGNDANGFAENIQATVGNLNAPVVFAGGAPGFEGLQQMNIEIPANASGSNLTLLIKVNDGDGKLVRANGVTISVQ